MKELESQNEEKSQNLGSPNLDELLHHIKQLLLQKGFISDKEFENLEKELL